ncbi:glycosyltransferase family 4 protein [Haliangium sp.]|uniref:glycosyltransferase family 4 protein n=1 Tax=Haliangium sp. TaxID=2663208 RepID=UPI003D0BB0D0
MRVLALTSLFPNSQRPLLSPYNRQQFAALGEMCELEVVGPVPWFPGARLFSRYTVSARMHLVPPVEEIGGMRVRHPRYLHLPRAIALSPLLFGGSLAREVLRYRGRVDVLLSAWAYPDGCAAIALAQALGVPCVVKLHGSDVNVLPERTSVRLYMRALLPRAARIVAVSRALGRRVTELGVAPDRVAVVYNGVDPELFHLRDRAAARTALGLPADDRIILYAGNLLETKGVHDLVAAFEDTVRRVPDARLVLVGDGPARAHCEEVARRVGPRLQLAGGQPLESMGSWIAACDVLTLPSWNEGTPNVILEAFACGRRVVATDVGGIPDLIDSELVGEMVPVRDRAALAAALARAAVRPYQPEQIAAAGARGDWPTSAAHLYEVLRAAVAESTAAAAAV